MDWCVDSSDEAAVRALRSALMTYVRRHADPETDLDGAELTVAELLSNAAEHAGGRVWVSLDWTREVPLLEVHDLGAGFEPRHALPPDVYSEGGRGLYLVFHLSDGLEVAAKRAGGSKVSARLPVRRPTTASFPLRRPSPNALPKPAEADEHGAFGMMPFLRALVVQLAQAVEETHGPQAAEAAISQVGTDVGARMEEAYRHTRNLRERLSADDLAALYIHLKAAIDGDFYLVDASHERIVLGNRRCPFGAVVQDAPALCRMTSSVFGGIAALNTGEAAVSLEERIAVGDPECRVTVWLGPLGAARAPEWAHRYRP